MTGDHKTKFDALDRLADVLVDDILNASDEEILAETADTYGNPERLATEMRELFENAVLEGGKAKLTAAKEAVTKAGKMGHAPLVKLDRNAVRRRYDRIVANDSELSAKLTLAARKGESQSERDIESAIEDLAELGVTDDEDDET